MSDFIEETESWSEAGENWRCPCCCRKRNDCEITTESGDKLRWLVYHHDHMRDYIKHYIKSTYGSFLEPIENKPLKSEIWRLMDFLKIFIVRFQPTLVCLDCNEIEGKLKKALNCDKFFSFHHLEIRRAFMTFPNERHIFTDEHLPFFEKLYNENYERLVLYRKSIVEALVKRAYERDMTWGGPIDLENHFSKHELAIEYPPLYSSLLIEIGLEEGKPVLQGYPWTVEQERKIQSLYETGASVEDIARKVGRTPGAIRAKIKEFNKK